MTKFQRRLIFYPLVLAFLLLAGWVSLRALGFTLDLQALILIEQGAIFLRATPAGATIYLDGLRYDAPVGIVRTQAFISNLTPGRHHVAIAKDGYYRWEKNFAVEPLEVTEVSTIRLLPRAPGIEPIGPISPASPIGRASTTQDLIRLERERRLLPDTASSTLASLELRPIPNTRYQIRNTKYEIRNTIRYRELLLSPDEKKVLVRTRNELWVIWLEKERVNGIHQPGQTEQIASFTDEITDALWLHDDSHHIVFAVGGKIKIAETDGRGGRNTIDLLEAQNVRFFLDPQTQKLLFADNEKLLRLTL